MSGRLLLLLDTNAAIATRDDHFKQVDGLQLITW
jgi:predicted nucleic acid-binding protein